MPGTSGLDLFEELAARGLRMPVMFITAYADVPMAVRAMKSGAVEFLEKPFNGQVLLEKIQRAVEDDADRISRESGLEEVRARLEKLTGKEREVLGMIRDGRPNKEIAARLEVTPRAVELRRASLMKKLGVSSLPELLRLTIGRRGGFGRSSALALIPTRGGPRLCLRIRGIHAQVSAALVNGVLGARPFGFAKGRSRRTLRSSVKESPVKQALARPLLFTSSASSGCGTSPARLRRLRPSSGRAKPVDDAWGTWRVLREACR